ncbi:dynamin family protein [Flavobacterium sp. CAN_S2]|uniref:dynamin family protein n=1 Tax=Flavobacterium sp. CAN_S2 TaxID=2787726 RepID=UPI0018CBC5BB
MIELINDSNFVRIVKRYNSTNTEDLELKIASWDKVLKTDVFTIPILGVQGAGKSSLLNALLMDDIVLPVDSDETTCIPTEIIYSKENNKEVEVHFLDGRIEKTSCDEHGLKKYVHQEDNPDNKKGVKCIKVYRNSPLLNNGVTFVDLPGVGSLSESNVKTTMDYIKKATGAIFLLRTTPPITNSESVFIKIAWPLLGKVFFVQNQWNDETLEEVKDGKDHSMLVLEKIANESKLHKSDIDIDVVNIYQSLTSKVTENTIGLEKSGLIDLENKIIKFIKSWKDDVYISVKNNIIILVGDTENALIQERESVTLDKEILKKEYADNRAEFEKEFSNSKEKYSEIKIKIEERKETLSLGIKETVRVSKESFRNLIRTNLDKGITDGPKLDKVYNDLKSEQVNIVFETIEPLFEDFIVEMQRYLEEIPGFSKKTRINNYESIGIKEKTKWESLLSKISSAGGGIGGAMGGYAAAVAIGVKLGATVGAAGGPVGIAIGIVAGAVGGFLGSYISSKIGKEGEKAVIKSRSEDARKIIFPLIDKWSLEIEKNIQAQFSQMTSELFKNIDSFYEKAAIDFKLNEQKLVENLDKNNEQKELLIYDLNNDLSEINRFYKILN